MSRLIIYCAYCRSSDDFTNHLHQTTIQEKEFIKIELICRNCGATIGTRIISSKKLAFKLMAEDMVL